jgi:hypothetical protein
MKIEEIFDAIVAERKYQAKRWGERQPDGTFLDNTCTPTEYLVYLQTYLQDAMRGATVFNGDKHGLVCLRKIVALGVRCFEEHGVPMRDLDEPVHNVRDGELA